MLKKNHTGKVSQCGKTGDIFLNMQSDTISKILLHLQSQKTPEGTPLTLKTAETAENPIFGKKIEKILLRKKVSNCLKRNFKLAKRVFQANDFFKNKGGTFGPHQLFFRERVA